MNVVADHLRSTEPSLAIWLAYSEELCEQAAGEFGEAWARSGNRSVSLVRYWGDHRLEAPLPKDGLLVAGLAKLYSQAMKNLSFIGSLASGCTLVVFDEAHQAVAPTYKLVLDTLVTQGPEAALLGLTATPGRTWNDPAIDRELALLFARQKVTLAVPGGGSPVDYLIQERYLARPQFKPLLHQAGSELSNADLEDLQCGWMSRS